MFRIHFVSAIRSLLKHRATSIINAAGLALGLTAFLFIIHYIIYERSYDSFFDNSDRIYRINMKITKADEVLYNGAHTPRQLYFALQNEVPEVESNTLTYFESCLVKHEDISFSDQKVLWVDDGFEKVFPMQMIRGNADFIRPLTGILSESKAKSIFGNEDPVGKILKINEGMPVEVTGIYKDMPSNTHLDADYFISIRTFVHYGWITERGEWQWWAWWNYIRLKDGVDPAQAEKTINGFIETHMGFLKDDGRAGSFFLQPVADLHFTRGLQNEFGSGTNEKSLFNLLLVAVLTLLVAWINYINLATAQSIKRAHEIGLRKLIGATKMHMWFQAIFESIMLNIIAVVLAFIVYKILLIPFSEYFEIPLATAYVPSKFIFGFLMLACLLGVLFSSFYITFNLTGINPFQKENLKPTKGGFKKGLVIVQLMISIVFISGTLLVYKQINFMRHYDLGMTINEVVSLSAPASTNIDSLRREKFIAFRNDLLQYPEFIAGTASMRIPGQPPRWVEQYERTDAETMSEVNFNINNGDDGLIKTYGLKLLAGQNFSINPVENQNKVLINEYALKVLGFSKPEDAIGKRFYNKRNKERFHEIAGVVNDFHNEGLHKSTYPMVWNNDHPYEFGYYSIRIHAEALEVALKKMEGIWQKHYPEDPFTFTFADEYFNRQYNSEVRFGKFYSALTILSILISSLGLYGLLVFYLSQKKKEIGIRKVNGANVHEIMLFINKSFILWGLMAFLIGIPLVYLVMSKWLQNFVYQTDISWWVFLTSGAITFTITILTVSWKSFRAASVNPIEALRYE